MSVQYDFYKNPKNSALPENNVYHARIVPSGTVTADELAREIHEYSSLSTGDVKGVLEMLSIVIVRHLQCGENIRFDGFGTLQMTIDCPPVVSQKEIRAESIRFKSIVFRPSAELKKNLRTTEFVRVANNFQSCKRSESDIDKLLDYYFQRRETMNRRSFQQLCGYTRTTALRQLKRLVEAGKLENIGDPQHPVYRRKSKN